MGKYRYKLLANLWATIHWLWIGVLLGGVIFLIGHPWYIRYHIAIVTFTLLLNLVLGGCPLTALEEKYRKAYNPSALALENAFLRVYIRKHLGINLSGRQVDWLAILIKIASYYIAIWFWVFPRR